MLPTRISTLTAYAVAMLVSLLFGLALLMPRHVHAAEPTAANSPVAATTARAGEALPVSKAEAAQRFDRALQLFESGDNAGALAEFKRAYEVSPDPLVLYNMGLVYAAMSRPVDAVNTLEKVIADGGKLNASQLQRAKQTLEDQKVRIARLTVSVKPAVARVEIDGIEVATTPLEAPIRIAEGKHVVGVVAEGYAPANKEVFVAGNTDVQLTLELVSTQGQVPGHITVRTRLPAAAILIDGRPVGETPLIASITAAPGEHSIELRRPGYSSLHHSVNLGSGATAEIAFEPVIDNAALDREGATLSLQLRESPAEFWVDGVRMGIYQQPLKLPRGPHHLRVSAPGFLVFERDITLEPTKDNVVPIRFEPTSETRRSHQASARFHRTWGWTAVISGAAIAAGGSVLAVIGGSRKSDGQRQLDAINTKYDHSEPPCDYLSGYQSAQYSSALCDKTISDAQSKLDSGKALATVGLVGIGVGGAALATGLILLLTGNDPNEYDVPAARAAGAAQASRFAFVPGPGQFGSAFQVAF